MGLLIMVLSNTEIPCFDMLKRVQQETWDAVSIPNVCTHYYEGTRYKMMHWAFKKALDEIWNMKWDVIFRTNSSAYVDKRLLNYIGIPPKYNYMGPDIGVSMKRPYPYASGSGFFITRLAADILRNELKEEPYFAEDDLIGKILHAHGIPLLNYKARYDVKHTKNETISGYWPYYRCKSDTDDRMKDVIAMYKIHEMFTHA